MNDELDRLIAAHRADRHRPPPHRVAQWHAAIDEAAASERGRQAAKERKWQPGFPSWGIAVAAALGLGIAIGLYVDEDRTHVDVQPGPTTVAALQRHGEVPASLSRGLQVHLRESRRQLVSLEEASNASILVQQIIEQNRMFESAAERSDAPQLARLLRAFEPILLEIAASDTAPEDAAALRAQLNFELGVVLTKLAHDSSNESHST